MRLVIVYDISTVDRSGEKRLRQAAKKCLDWGIRVQNSVFECDVNAGQYRELKLTLSRIIDPDKDSVRLYSLGNHYRNRIETLGKATELWDRESYVI